MTQSDIDSKAVTDFVSGHFGLTPDTEEARSQNSEPMLGEGDKAIAAASK